MVHLCLRQWTLLPLAIPTNLPPNLRTAPATLPGFADVQTTPDHIPSVVPLICGIEVSWETSPLPRRLIGKLDTAILFTNEEL